MKELQYTIELYSYWMQFDKDGQNFAEDMVPVTENGLPIFGGKALKGLLKDQLKILQKIDALQCTTLGDELSFDTATTYTTIWSSIKVSSAKIKENIALKDRYALTDTHAQTALGKYKSAERGSLRTLKTLVPISLQGSITIDLNELESNQDKNLIEDLQNAALLIKEIGFNRYKGLGRCRITISEKETEETPEKKEHKELNITEETTADNLLNIPNKIDITITAISPLVLKRYAGSEIKSVTEDYISGNKLLGILASKYFGNIKSDSSLLDALFFGGTVQYANCYPVITSNNTSLPAPNTLKYQDKKYTYTPEKDKKAKRLKEKYISALDDDSIQVFEVPKGERIKSARDYKNRKSADQQMYLHGFVEAGTVFKGSITINASNQEQHKKIVAILNTLEGKQFIGTSRNSEFGQIDIQLESSTVDAISTITEVKNETVKIYLKSDLCLLNKNNTYTTLLQPSYFGLTKGTIDYTKSAIQHGTYSRFSGIRKTPDASRAIIKAGSVIVIKNATGSIPNTIGVHQVEGCGELLINPKFLEAETIEAFQKTESTNSLKTEHIGIEKRINRFSKEAKRFKDVGELIQTYETYFVPEISKNQWGAIRSIIQIYLFETSETSENESLESRIEHFIRERDTTKWTDRHRDLFKDILYQKDDENKFVMDKDGNKIPKHDKLTLLEFVVEMAKRAESYKEKNQHQLTVEIA